MTELISGIVGALIGAIAAYGLGWWQKLSDDQRRRQSLATALLIETSWIADSLRHLREEWGRRKAVVRFPMAAHESFAQHLEHFRPNTVYKVLDFAGSLRDIQEGLDVIRGGEATNVDELREEVRFLARVVLMKGLSAARALKEEGGRIPEDTALPSEDAVQQFLEDVKKPWKLEQSDVSDRAV
ncbi:MAG: hypothetical protein ABR543_01050 [Gemmatimonadaceae bacterium]